MMFLIYLLNLKTIVFTFVYFSDVSDPSIDFCTYFSDGWLREVGLTIRTVSACPKAVPLESLQT